MLAWNEMDFSVSMSVYKNDDPKCFQEAIDSIINQTITPTELVLVVDGPVPDEIAKIITEYVSKYAIIKPVWLANNVGHANARRRGLESCSYNLVALMDSDDISEPDRFEKQLKCFENNDSISIVGGNILEFTGSIENIVGLRIVPTNDSDIKQYLKSRCPFNQVTVMFKKADVLLAGGYIDWYCNEDYYLWIRMCQKKLEFKNLEDILVKVRVDNNTFRRRGGWRYFCSEAKLQGYMLKNGIISYYRYIFNIGIRLIVQVFLPYWLRSKIFNKLFRKRPGQPAVP